MAQIGEMAQNYEPPQTKNIADLDKVSVKLEVFQKTFKEGTIEEFTLNLVSVDGVEHRVPTSVLSTLKDILAVRPDLEFFKVTKTGEGLKTKYSVIPL